MELQRNTHHVFRLMYHFVWIPKYRHKVFIEPYRSTMKAIIQKVGYDYDIDIVELEIPSDHIHMVIRGIPKQSPSDVMQIIKSITACEFFRSYPEIKKQYFWGGKLWTQSFFVETIGNATEEVIRKYVQEQLIELDGKEINSDPLNLF
ncbi:IS200/IS605 family transposase [Pseudocolwellia sp. HL-MZ7]|uniref:IS200/IS605 family transposase n=1 Tax=Pseudocolwellia sp. HL-MZ7 TaxID=3400627 RepID=UPI003CFA69CF